MEQETDPVPVAMPMQRMLPYLCSSSSAVVPVVARSQICAARARPTKGRWRVSGSVPGWILNAQARITEAALAKLRDCSTRLGTQGSTQSGM